MAIEKNISGKDYILCLYVQLIMLYINRHDNNITVNIMVD